MKAIRVHACGGPEAMVLEDLPLPSPAKGQVLVAVKAAGINLFDTQLRSGLYKHDLPLTLGLEGAGIVEAVGADAADIAVGDRVATGLDHYIADRHELRARTDELFAWVVEGRLKQKIFHSSRLEDVLDAHRAIESRGTTGKLLVIP